MPLASGTRLGPYAISAPVGAGGMGEVYKAIDTRLDRTVAIKVLPEHVASDPELKQRFEREAKTISRLNHPHICTLHDVGSQEGIDFLVMEYLEGETLAQRLTKGALPLEQALLVATQIADALDKAHRQGIVHRDLKPGNIMLTKGGAKLLDFGLAKLRPVGMGGAAAVSAAPTVSSPLTSAGSIVGTFQYMAPEQLEGQEADARTDVFAFGTVLYEMLTGRKAFEGKTQASLIAAILRAEPPRPSTLQPAMPAAVDRLLTTCLAKDPDDRWQTVRDMARELSWIAATASAERREGQRSSTRSQTPWQRQVLVAVSALIAGVAATWTLMGLDDPSAITPARVDRFVIVSGGGTSFTVDNGDRQLALTPDGNSVVYVADNSRQLSVRSFDQLEPALIHTGSGLRGPFVSPDGRWVAFANSGDLRLQKVPVAGGPTVFIAQMNGNSRGATWMPDDEIIFATNGGGGLLGVSARGGEVSVLTNADTAAGERDHVFPERLPDAKGVLFTILSTSGDDNTAQLAVFDPSTGMIKKLLVGGSHAHFVPSGHLVFAAENTLRAVRFDLARLEVQGAPFPVVPHVAMTADGGAQFAVSADGTLVYLDADTASLEQRVLTWLDRRGEEEELPTPPRPYAYARVAPDGSKVAVAIADDGQDIWVWDLPRAVLTRLTFDPALDDNPAWTQDGKSLIFRSRRGGGESHIYEQAADGSGAVSRVTGPEGGIPTGISPDGSQIVFFRTPAPGQGPDLLVIDRPSRTREGTQAASAARTLWHTPLEERDGIISPDGRWLAYVSNVSGSFQVYVRPWPNTLDGQWQVSTAGGRQPLWSRSGRELFYLSASDGTLMRVSVEASDGQWKGGAPSALIECGCLVGGLGRTYDIAPDDKRFLMIKRAAQTTAAFAQIVVVRNWFEELTRLVPTD